MDPITLHFITRLLMFLVFAQAMADCVTTNMALRLPGAREANPLMAFVMRVVKEKWVLVRLVMALGTIYGSIGQPDKWAVLALGFNFLLMAYVIFNNIRVIQRQAALANG